MRLCMPTLDEAGLEGRLAGHFGSAPYYTIVETESSAVEVVSNAHARHVHGTCEAASGMGSREVDAVVCQGLGRRAFAGLAAAGIPVFLADEVSVAAAVAGFRAGRLAQLTRDGACGGGQGHGCHEALRHQRAMGATRRRT
jgi:predicted Fe-Mo cluster-binding NifX family protein